MKKNATCHLCGKQNCGPFHTCHPTAKDNRIATLESRLALAVEALEEIGYYDREIFGIPTLDELETIARAALETIKGER